MSDDISKTDEEHSAGIAGKVLAGVAVLVFVLFIVGDGCETSCTDRDGAAAALLANGYSRIHLLGYQGGNCGDCKCTGFEATGPTGARVRGVVGCGCGPFSNKGCTVRVQSAVPGSGR